MGWSYSGNPGDSPRDHVRFLIGDTDVADPLDLSDEEIEFVLGVQTVPIRAAAVCARRIAAKFRRDVSFSMEGTAIQAQQRAEQYDRLADQLESEANRDDVVAAGITGAVLDENGMTRTIFEIGHLDNRYGDL